MQKDHMYMFIATECYWAKAPTNKDNINSGNGAY